MLITGILPVREIVVEHAIEVLARRAATRSRRQPSSAVGSAVQEGLVFGEVVEEDRQRLECAPEQLSGTSRPISGTAPRSNPVGTVNGCGSGCRPRPPRANPRTQVTQAYRSFRTAAEMQDPARGAVAAGLTRRPRGPRSPRGRGRGIAARGEETRRRSPPAEELGQVIEDLEARDPPGSRIADNHARAVNRDRKARLPLCAGSSPRLPPWPARRCCGTPAFR